MPRVICDVLQAGAADDGHVWLRLREENDQFDAWFYALERAEREMLATALLAVSTGYQVEATIASTAPDSQIDRLYVIRQ